MSSQINQVTHVNCAECGYDLRGHARVERCPECGLCYDLSQLEIHARPRSGMIEYGFQYYAFAVVGITVGIIVPSIKATNGSISPAQLFATMAIVVALSAVPALVFRHMIRRRWPRRLTLTDDGLLFTSRTNPDKSRLWKWSRMRSATRWQPRFGSPCIRIIYRGLACFLTGGLFVDLDVSKAQAGIILYAIQHRLKSL